jgi:hypothetical protein
MAVNIQVNIKRNCFEFMNDIDFQMIAETQTKLGVDAACKVAKMLLHHSIDERRRNLDPNPILQQLEWFEKNRDALYGIPKELL